MPPPGPSASSRLPPCASAIHRAIGSPSPLPESPGWPPRPRWNRSNTRCRSAAAMPIPHRPQGTRLASPSVASEAVAHRIGRRVLDGVLQQIEQCSLETLRIDRGVHVSPCASALQPHASFGDECLQLRECSLEKVRQLDGTRFQALFPGVVRERERVPTMPLMRSISSMLPSMLRGLGESAGSPRAPQVGTMIDRGVPISWDALGMNRRGYRALVDRAHDATRVPRPKTPTSANTSPSRMRTWHRRSASTCAQLALACLVEDAGIVEVVGGRGWRRRRRAVDVRCAEDDRRDSSASRRAATRYASLRGAHARRR